ncbi:MAG: hypothetical protein VX776_03600, partial [Planctomycetota bacterium]|nr:hypothetical protein [Planctomycetota bacterium]
TSARIYHALGQQVSVFRWLGRWNDHLNVPARSLLMQTIVVLLMVIGFGLQEDGFELLVLFVSPFMWTFLALIGLSVFLVRNKGLGDKQSYRTPFYPVLPLLFIGSSLFMVYRSLTWLQFQIQDRQLLTNSFFIFILVFTGGVVLSAVFASLWSDRQTPD